MPKYLIKMSGRSKRPESCYHRAILSVWCISISLVFLLGGLTSIERCWAQEFKKLASPSTPESKDEFHDTREEGFKIAQREYKLGLIDFKAKRYRDALRRFNRVYRIKPQPNLVYNMARSFEQLYEYESAAVYYQRYLTLSPESDDREQVELTIETMKRLSTKTKRQPQSELPARPINRVLLWSGVATGGAMMIGGIFLGSRALSLDQDLSDAQYDNSVSDFDATLKRRDQAALFADVLTISGAAITGVSLYFMLSNLKSSSQTTASTSAQVDHNPTSFQMILSPTSLTVSGAF
jgi:tetratricopeptide (TPR) repeat protein